MSEKIYFDIKSFPLRVYWLRGAFAFLIILFTVILTYVFSKSFVWAGLAFMIVTVPSTNFLFPARYLFFDDEFQKQQLLSKQNFDYKEIRDVRIGKDGVLIERKRARAFDIVFIFNEKLREDLYHFLEGKYGREEEE